MSWMSWQIDYLLLLQSFRGLIHGVLDQFFLFISEIAIAPFTVVLMCVIYWSVNKKLGLYMIYCNCVSLLMNAFLKFTFCIYRPWLLDSRVHPVQGAFATATGYSFPSGHTAGAVSTWGAIGMYFRKNKIVLSICALIVLLVIFSRNYLGVHTPQDVIVSLIVGIGILFFVQKIMKKIETDKNFDIIFLLIITVLCVILSLYLMLKSYPVDYVNGVILYDNTDAKFNAIYKNSRIIAVFLGGFLEARFIKYNPGEYGIFTRVVIAITGLAILFLIDAHLYGSLEKFFDSKIVCLTGNFITGLFIIFIYPAIIKGLSLLKEKCFNRNYEE